MYFYQIVMLIKVSVNSTYVNIFEQPLVQYIVRTMIRQVPEPLPRITMRCKVKRITKNMGHADSAGLLGAGVK